MPSKDWNNDRLMSNSISPTTSQNGKATTLKTTFHRETTVSIRLSAPSEVIWDILTRAVDYSKWNSTIVSLEGRIAPGSTIKLVSKLDPRRIFTLSIKEFVPHQKLVWGDRNGTRVYTLARQDEA